MDLLDIAPLLRVETHNLSGTQPTMIEQVGQPLLALVSQHCLYPGPDLAGISMVIRDGLSWLSRCRSPGFSWTRVGPQRLQDNPIQTRMQIGQYLSECLI